MWLRYIRYGECSDIWCVGLDRTDRSIIHNLIEGIVCSVDTYANALILIIFAFVINAQDLFIFGLVSKTYSISAPSQLEELNVINKS